MVRDLASFEPLWPAELRLVQELPSGLTVGIGGDLPGYNAPREVRVRASFLRYLALGGCARCRPPERGVWIRGAYVEGDGADEAETRGLDLAGCDLPSDLRLFRCRLPDQVLARGTKGKTLGFDRCHLSIGLSAEGLRLEGGLLLRHASVFGVVRLNQSRIDSVVDLEDSGFFAEPTPGENTVSAINADGISVGGNLSFIGTRARDQITIQSSSINGDLYFQCAVIGSESPVSRESPILRCQGANISGSVNFYNAQIFGSVNFYTASIGGSLHFDDGKISAQRDTSGTPGNAISADNLKVRGDLSFRRAQFTGKSRFYSINVEGEVDFTKGKFKAIKSTDVGSDLAFSAGGMKASAVTLDGVEVCGRFSLTQAEVDSLSCDGGHFFAETDIHGKHGFSLAADGIKVARSFRAMNVKARGEFRLLGAQIGGDLNVIGGSFSDGNDSFGPPGHALSLDAVNVGSRIRLNNVRANGIVTLLGAHVGRDVDCDGAQFASEDRSTGQLGTALRLGLSVVKGALFLRKTVIKGEFDAQAAEFGSIVHDANSWPPKGYLSIDGCRYGAWGNDTADARERLHWLDLQYPDTPNTMFLPQPYEQLAKALRDMGHTDDARIILIEKERRRRAAENSRKRGVARFVHRGWTQALSIIGYGYLPHRAIWPATIFVLFGALLVWYANAQGVMLPTTIPVKDTAAPRLVPLAYSFESFVPFIDLDQIRAFRPDMSTLLGCWVQVYLWFQSIVGWVIGGVAAAGVLRLFQRNGLD